MWSETDKYKKPIIDYNKELLELKGDLNDKQAKISLAKFLRHNIAFTVELISGIKLAPVQEIVLRGCSIETSACLSLVVVLANHF